MRKSGLLLGLVFLAACSQGGNAPDTRPLQISSERAVAVTVNGIPVPEALVQAVARAHDLDLTLPEQREQSLKLVTDFVLLAQTAQQNNYFADPMFRANIEAARLQGVGNAAMLQLQQQTPVTDAVVKAEYDAQVAKAGKQTYDFSQLLFANEADALKAAGDAMTGKSFSEVFDAWRGKAAQAKTFTRVRQDQLPEALAKALSEMKNNETTKVPVKTQFGWHVVHLDIANPFTPPPFDQVKDSVRSTLLLKIGQQRLEKLKEQAKIEYPAGTAAPAKKPAAAVTAP